MTGNKQKKAKSSGKIKSKQSYLSRKATKPEKERFPQVESDEV